MLALDVKELVAFLLWPMTLQKKTSWTQLSVNLVEEHKDPMKQLRKQTNKLRCIVVQHFCGLYHFRKVILAAYAFIKNSELFVSCCYYIDANIMKDYYFKF